MTPRYLLVPFCSLFVLACGCSKALQPSPMSPRASAQPAPQPSGEPAQSAVAAPPSEQVRKGHAESGTAPGTPQPAKAQIAGNIEELTDAVELALSRCTEACRALAALERAVARVCETAESRAQCDAAKTRLREARARVKAACKACPHGPATDPDAPIGSP